MSILVLNELLSALQKHRDAENLFLPPDEQLPPYDTEDILKIVNESPELLRATIEEITADHDSFIGGDIADQSISDYLEALHDDWNMLPSDMHVQEGDYRNIKEYFQRKQNYIDLTQAQQTLLDSLAIPWSDFRHIIPGIKAGIKSSKVGFKFTGEAVKSWNLRQQILHRLVDDNVLDQQTALALMLLLRVSSLGDLFLLVPKRETTVVDILPLNLVF